MNIDDNNLSDLEKSRQERIDSTIAPYPGDVRCAYQHDRDRLIHSTALRRLTGVTQVADPLEGHNFHNRLTHTLKVSQIAQRIAERFLQKRDKEKDPVFAALIDRLGGLDIEVVQAAALAHDIGLAPFGHSGEETLKNMVTCYSSDGFEGNAQTFRTVTKLAAQNAETAGLNLTRATLRAILKYPWMRDTDPTSDSIRTRKWGAYETERGELEFARDLTGDFARERMSLEAAIMDMADDIAYATHDVEDFYRAHKIPLHLLFIGPRRSGLGWTLNSEAQNFLSWAQEQIAKTELRSRADQVEQVFKNMRVFFFGIEGEYRDTRKQRAILRMVTSYVIHWFISNLHINPNAATDENDRVLFMDDEDQILLELKLLKYLTAYYVHSSRPLVTQQCGTQRVVKELFEVFFTVATGGDKLMKPILPPDYGDLFNEEAQRVDPHSDAEVKALHARIVADVISRMTDDEALRLHHRLTGHTPGLITDFML
jgi:dGTPase